MSELLEDIQRHLPQYLSAPASTALFSEFTQFPANIDSRIYTSYLENERTIFQGDGLSDLPTGDLPANTLSRARVMVLSNTCDVSPENERKLGACLIYCPIIRLSAYENMLSSEGTPGLSDHIAAIRQQKISNMFYLPENQRLGSEGIAMLDRINNCDLSAIDLASVLQGRLFTLSNYGFYLFLFKLSIHLTRIREGVSRNPPSET